VKLLQLLRSVLVTLGLFNCDSHVYITEIEEQLGITFTLNMDAAILRSPEKWLH